MKKVNLRKYVNITRTCIGCPCFCNKTQSPSSSLDAPHYCTYFSSWSWSCVPIPRYSCPLSIVPIYTEPILTYWQINKASPSLRDSLDLSLRAQIKCYPRIVAGHIMLTNLKDRFNALYFYQSHYI